MKYFFIRKDECFGGGKKFIQHPTKQKGRNLIIICEEEVLKNVIHNNKMDNFRRVKPFRNGSIVKLRDSDVYSNSRGRTVQDKEVVITELNLEKNSRFSFKGNTGAEFMVDSIEEVIQY